MFQFLRRVSGSFLPRPDRPWRDDATSHAPTIGRKRRYSVTEQDVADPTSSTAKRTKNNFTKPDIECDSGSERESVKEDVVYPVEGQDVKEVTKGVKEVDLEDKDETESIRPEGVPLPDSPFGSPEPESPELATLDVVAESKDEEHADDKESVASSSHEDGVEEASEDSAATNVEDGTTLVKSVLHDTSATLAVEVDS